MPIDYNSLSKEQLIARVKQAWRCYFISNDSYWESYDNTTTRMRTAIEVYNTTQDTTHLINQFKEMYDELNKNHECPICFETIVKDTMFMPTCGHMICNGCHTTLQAPKKCPCCRKKI